MLCHHAHQATAKALGSLFPLRDLKLLAPSGVCHLRRVVVNSPLSETHRDGQGFRSVGLVSTSTLLVPLSPSSLHPFSLAPEFTRGSTLVPAIHVCFSSTIRQFVRPLLVYRLLGSERQSNSSHAASLKISWRSSAYADQLSSPLPRRFPPGFHPARPV